MYCILPVILNKLDSAKDPVSVLWDSITIASVGEAIPLSWRMVQTLEEDAVGG